MPLTPCQTPGCPMRVAKGNTICCHCRARQNKAPRRFHCDAMTEDGSICAKPCYGKNCRAHTAFTGNKCPYERKDGSICGASCRKEYCKYHRPEYIQRMRVLNAGYKKAKRAGVAPVVADA